MQSLGTELDKPRADTITLGQPYFWGDNIDRIVTLIHELRHADECFHKKYLITVIINSGIFKFGYFLSTQEISYSKAKDF
ncbi:MAG: hypothetical protein V4654_01200 [Bdellovibrionota bacterium]